MSTLSILTCPAVGAHDLTFSVTRRVLLDRAYTDFDNIFHGLDPEMLDLPLPTSPPPPPPPPTTTSCSPATDKFASTSETNTSDRSSSTFNSSLSSPSSTDLSQILLNIKSCRWRHFRPRTLPLHELDNAHPLFRKLSRSLKRPVSASTAGGQPFGLHRPARVVPVPAPTAGESIGCTWWIYSIRLSSLCTHGLELHMAIISLIRDLLVKIRIIRNKTFIYSHTPPASLVFCL